MLLLEVCDRRAYRYEHRIELVDTMIVLNGCVNGESPYLSMFWESQHVSQACHVIATGISKGKVEPSVLMKLVRWNQLVEEERETSEHEGLSFGVEH